MDTDETIIVDVLRKLDEKKGPKQFPQPVTIPIEAAYEGVPNPFEIPGYSPEQIEHNLKELLKRGLITGSELKFGVFFRGLTPAGNHLLTQANSKQ